ncbi:MAG: response regulator [Granulosicoccus sp.]
MRIHWYEAVLIDWNLPDGEGFGVARHVRSIHRTLPIVFLSSVFTEDQAAQARQYQPKACLLKSIGQEYVDTLLGHLHHVRMSVQKTNTRRYCKRVR